MKKVLFIINDLKMGGAQRVATTVIDELVRSGYQTTVLTNQPASTDFFKPHILTRYTTGLFQPSSGLLNGVINNIKRIRRIRQVIDADKPDTVFSFMTETNILTLISTLFRDVRVVVSERSDPEKEKKGFAWSMLRRLTYCYADAVTSNSQSTLDFLSKYVADNKLALLPNPVTGCDSKNPAQDSRNRENTLLAVARLDYVKGIDLLIDAIDILEARGSSYRVIVAGDGPEKENLMARAASKKVEKSITWLGRSNDLRPLYGSAALLIMPSRREGVPNAMLEAMSCGLPVIVSDASAGPLEYVVDGKTGSVFQSEAAGSLADKIEALMSSPDLRDTCGAKAYERVRPLLASSIMPLWEAVIFKDNNRPVN